jgi:transcriptional regulator with XRE-family HTH domain
VRKQRKELGLSQMDLADASELHFTYISQVERGTTNVSIENLARLARGLRMDLGDLTEGLQRRRGRIG